MKQIIHYAIKLDTFGGKFEGNKCVALEIVDKDLNCMDCYPIPLDIAEDLGGELVRLAKEMRTI